VADDTIAVSHEARQLKAAELQGDLLAIEHLRRLARFDEAGEGRLDADGRRFERWNAPTNLR
jgi:hypothetical protein